MPFGSRLAVLAVLALGSCAAPGSDVHLAPFWTSVSTADGGRLTEVAGGLYRQHRRASDDFLEWACLAPLYGIRRQRDGDYISDHPALLGRTRRAHGETTSYTVPLYLGWTKTQADGSPRSLWLTITGITYQAHDGERNFGWFPFYGRFENVFTFDSASFFLWPLYVANERAGRRSKHVLWPFFGWTRGGGESSWHVFPLIGRASWEGRYDRTYFLWPFFHWQKDHLGGGGEEPETTWMLFPLIGHRARGTFDAWTFLWPFFGYSRDPRSGFWALDCPFPLVRFQRGPDGLVRTHAWPLYSHFEGEGLTTTSFGWPIFYHRHETDARAERDSWYAVPVWQTWDRLDKETGEESAYRKLWPLWRWEDQGEWSKGALLELDPFFKNEVIPRNFTSFFRLWEWEEAPAFRRERSFLGLYRHEHGRGEDRRSLSGLWARRSYADEGGQPVRETSLLFGLLRWRVTDDQGFDMLRPAFPGPGWPAPADPGPTLESKSYF